MKARVVHSNITMQEASAHLGDVLQVSLDDRTITTSTSVGHAVKNKLVLNIKNTGSSPLFSGNNPWPIQPKVAVSFLYGEVSGALASDNDPQAPKIGSAWNINARLINAQSNEWTVINPSPSGSRIAPVWILSPTPINRGIIGTGVNSNVTFEFDNIVSLNPPGHTNMIIQFVGFPKNDNASYNDYQVVLDIIKK